MIIVQNMEQLKNLYDPYAFTNHDFCFDYDTNNSLKMHHKPMRRKPFKKKHIILDEYTNIKL